VDLPDPQGILLAADLAAPPRTLIDILRHSAETNPQSSALTDAEGSLSYRELVRAVNASAARLVVAGVRRGDRVGIRIPSGTRTLYISILAVLLAGASYVPVDSDDPEERAEMVFTEAAVVGIVGADGLIAPRGDVLAGRDPDDETLDSPSLGSPTGSIAAVDVVRPTDDAWVIFTSGSTGVPKGVAVTHRSAAAFVDAEARLFLQGEPIGPGDNVLAGLSVAFDASCEEMWLAWRNGACLVPAPRSLVRSGVDLGPWLIAHSITIVSTVPALAGLWPVESLELVRLLIFGGEACPPELVERLAVDGREVWNTYGPTEATVVASAALLVGGEPVRIGLPLEGWDLAVVDEAGAKVGEGESGELIIGGVGLARYLDPAKDAEKFAPMPTLGWERAYRSGDVVRFELDGLVFQGRADDQIKLGGRRIELGEIDAALSALPGVASAATVVQVTPAGNRVLVGYLLPSGDASSFDTPAALARLRDELPAPLVPLLAVVDDMPTRTSGKVDKAALPWPLTTSESAAEDLGETARWLAEQWTSILGTPVTGPDDDFFAHGGGSLTAAQLISAIRQRFPEARVSDIYDRPRIGALAAELDGRAPAIARETRTVLPTPRSTQLLQTVLGIPLHILAGIRWAIYVIAINNLLAAAGVSWAVPVSWWIPIIGALVFITPVGRMAISVVAARLLLAGLEPGDYPRGGGIHLRLWLAEQVANLSGATNLAGAPWISYYARALGAKIGPGVDLHTLPPITGMLKIGAGASIEPEVDLRGYWVDGDVVHIGEVTIGAEASVGARSTLLPGTRVGKGSEIEAGSAVHGRIPAGQLWAGSPAVRVGKARNAWPDERPPVASRWLLGYGLGSLGLAILPLFSLALGLVIIGPATVRSADLGGGILHGLAMLPLAVAGGALLYTLLTIGVVRLLGVGVKPGEYPVRSRIGWQVWMTERLLDSARTLLFPLYAALVTPLWLRLLGAKVGSNVEASTVLLLPRMTVIDDNAFLADDTMVASYELGHGWMRIDRSRIGRRAFLGNSGMAAPGRTVPKNGLIAVLSATPRKAKNGSSWLGNPPVRLRRAVSEFDESRTFQPLVHLRLARFLWELGRFVPVVISVAIALGVLALLDVIMIAWGIGWAIVLSGAVLLLAGGVAAGITTVAKWALVGRIAVREHPLWSSFVWRNEVADTFVEMVAAPWFAVPASGAPALNVWLRTLGAKIGKGVWCESYWLPEADLVELGDGATVNRGCVVQTHLFHDRVMVLDTVHVEAGATLGPHSVILPAATIGESATVGPASLVLRGEFVPKGGLWAGNPIAPWHRAE
jgi:non-ribosomal peptide synthetase-like protein